MSETVSTRLPRELIGLMEREAAAKGVSLSTLLRAIVEGHYGVDVGKPAEKPFLVELQEVLDVLGRAKMANCLYRGKCPLKVLKPSPLLCALCQIHGHAVGFLESTTFNPYAGLKLG